ncbi:hypothetical protein FZC66_07395 [Priestia megaterium]|nr:hypothetical protein FZC66_07395 [Priestia megaterium]
MKKYALCILIVLYSFFNHFTIADAKEPRFQYRYNYTELQQFLNMSKAEFKKEWHDGKTIAQMAEKRKIDEQQLLLYLADEQFKQLDSALKEGEIDKPFYYDYTMTLMRDNILSFIHTNAHKSQTKKQDKPIKTLAGQTRNWRGKIEFLKEDGEVKSYTTVQPIKKENSEKLLSVDTVLSNNLKAYDVKDSSQVTEDITFAMIEVTWKEEGQKRTETIVARSVK